MKNIIMKLAAVLLTAAIMQSALFAATPADISDDIKWKCFEGGDSLYGHRSYWKNKPPHMDILNPNKENWARERCQTAIDNDVKQGQELIKSGQRKIDRAAELKHLSEQV